MTRRRKILLSLVCLPVAIWGALRLSGCGGMPPVGAHLVAPATLPAVELLEGRWVGRWESGSGIMRGELLCDVRKLAESSYEATFDAEVFGKSVRHKTVVVLTAQKHDGMWSVSGEKDLGFLSGGTYSYTGQTNGADFNCAYTSALDSGVFRLARPSPSPATTPLR